MTTAQQPEALPDALRLADWFDHIARGGEVVEIEPIARSASEELRRLHALTTRPEASVGTNARLYDPSDVGFGAQPAARVEAVGWTDDQMIRFGNYITSQSLRDLSYEQRLEVFRGHEAVRGIAAPPAPEALEVKQQ